MALMRGYPNPIFYDNHQSGKSITLVSDDSKSRKAN